MATSSEMGAVGGGVAVCAGLVVAVGCGAAGVVPGTAITRGVGVMLASSWNAMAAAFTGVGVGVGADGVAMTPTTITTTPTSTTLSAAMTRRQDV
jgi:hypothetical protein